MFLVIVDYFVSVRKTLLYVFLFIYLNSYQLELTPKSQKEGATEILQLNQRVGAY